MELVRSYLLCILAREARSASVCIHAVRNHCIRFLVHGYVLYRSNAPAC
jgi:hypothetical protein